MTIESENSRIQLFIGSGNAGPFTINFRLLSIDDIIVTHIGTSGTLTIYSSPANYTGVLIDDGLSGASITTTVNIEAGETLIIQGCLCVI